ncbi:hypothetical protein BTO32_15410 [Marinobacter lutaoensis]|uniref:Uncharacterized protein n=1 Tax=Marinobacter lutaoensis TaxID=135739 RepID=A0A1V2DPK9_9GAMM|nr:hypothetical protein BTO32_15410 [Marinobacter lutaoensis]
MTTEDLMLDIGYGILVARIVHGFILGTILGVSISALLLGFSALWVSVKRYNPGAASFGAMLIGGALMLGFERLLEPAPNTVADAFEQMGHDIAALPVHTLALVLAALAVEGLAFAWHRYRHHEQQ